MTRPMQDLTEDSLLQAMRDMRADANLTMKPKHLVITAFGINTMVERMRADPDLATQVFEEFPILSYLKECL